MRQEAQFSGYMSAVSHVAARAYLNGYVFPELNRLHIRRRRARNVNLIITGCAALISIMIPILLLMPYALPDQVTKLAVSGLCVVVTAILFVQTLLGLPAQAAEYRVKQKQLTALLHAYFLGCDEFAGVDDDQKKLARLCERVESILKS